MRFVRSIIRFLGASNMAAWDIDSISGKGAYAGTGNYGSNYSNYTGGTTERSYPVKIHNPPIKHSKGNNELYIAVPEYDKEWVTFDLFVPSVLEPNKVFPIARRTVYMDTGGKISDDLLKVVDQFLMPNVKYTRRPESIRATVRYMRAKCLLGNSKRPPGLIIEKNLIRNKVCKADLGSEFEASSIPAAIKMCKEYILTRRKMAIVGNEEIPLYEYAGIWLNWDPISNLAFESPIYNQLDPLMVVVNRFTSKEQLEKVTDVTI